MDAQAIGRLELGLVVVADSAFGHQSRGLVGEAMPAFSGTGQRMLVSVLASVRHDPSPC